MTHTVIPKGGVFLKIRWKRLLLCLAVPLGAGGLSALLTMGSMETFEGLRKPPLSPPGWLFPVVWTILFLMMGLASYLALESGGSPREIGRALRAYGLQLGANFVWPLLFFNLGAYLAAFAWLVLLWLLIWAAALRFRRLSAAAAWLLAPYLLWVAFAGYLNLGIYLLNR